jgi:hypothetical protein
MKKKRAIKQIRIYPETHERLRRLAFKKRKSIAEVADQLSYKSSATAKKSKQAALPYVFVPSFRYRTLAHLLMCA